MSKLDFGELLDHPEAVLFHSASTGGFVPVEDMAQGARGFIEQFFGHTVSVLYSDTDDHRPRRRMMLHKVIRHRDVAIRAYQLFASPEGASAEANWLRAERELLSGSDGDS